MNPPEAISLIRTREIATQPIQKSEWPARDDMLGWLRICSQYAVCINAKM